MASSEGENKNYLKTMVNSIYSNAYRRQFIAQPLPGTERSKIANMKDERRYKTSPMDNIKRVKGSTIKLV